MGGDSSRALSQTATSAPNLQAPQAAAAAVEVRVVELGSRSIGCRRAVLLIGERVPSENVTIES